MAETFCDIGKHFRDWLLSIDEVAEWLGENEAVIDTIDDDSCPPLIWFSRAATRNGDTLVNCGSGLPEEVVYEIEVIGPERMLADTRRIADCIRVAADEHVTATPFGEPDSGLHIQLIDVLEVTDEYVPRAYPYVEASCFTALRIELTPI